jgi:hypothetical protein
MFFNKTGCDGDYQRKEDRDKEEREVDAALKGHVRVLPWVAIDKTRP